MKELLPPDRAGLLGRPIARALMLSLCLHLAVLILIHPAPGSGTPATVVINARLDTAEPDAIVVKAAAEEAALESPALEPPLVPPPEPGPPASAPEPIPLAIPRESAAPLPSATPAPMAPAPATPSTPAPAPAAPPAPATIGPETPSPLPSLPLGIDDTWYLARQVDSHAKAIGRIEPAYPEEARRGNLEGSLKLMVKIDELGRVISAEVVEARPSGVFDRAALDAFRQARFHPAIKDGRPVRYQAYIRVDFKLEN